jgi:hypothetical protein
MTLCPIAIVAGCRKCPAFSICPLKNVIGDQGKAEADPAPPAAKAQGSAKARKSSGRRRS